MLNGQDMGATHRFDTMNRDRAAWILAAATTLFHLLTTAGYGIFRDELYYLACADHIAWGYVDQPPLVAVFAWAVRHLLGTSLLALRLWPALSAGILVMLSAAIARQWRHIHDRHLWPGAGVALVLFAPHVIWQVAHGWPTVEFIQRATAYKNVAHSPLDFMAAQIEMMNPVAALLLLVGFGVLFCIARSPPVPRLGLGHTLPYSS